MFFNHENISQGYAGGGAALYRDQAEPDYFFGGADWTSGGDVAGGRGAFSSGRVICGGDHASGGIVADLDSRSLGDGRHFAFQKAERSVSAACDGGLS